VSRGRLERGARGPGGALALCAGIALGVALVSGGSTGHEVLGATDPESPKPPPDGAAFDVVVVDPGHGGPDHGARGPSGSLEKDVVLALARRLGGEIARLGLAVVYTRKADAFVSLAERAQAANQAGGDLFLSIHANSAPDPAARGFETYFLSLEASDAEALRVAEAENHVFSQDGAVPDASGVVGGILGDLIRVEHLARSSEIARAIQRGVPVEVGESRGVKQAPFAVLMGVNMPAALLEVGFLTHAEDERLLLEPAHQRRLARAVAGAVRDFRDARSPRAEAAP
jgi:N-acetylmuramoyl-L-alanine amidase